MQVGIDSGPQQTLASLKLGHLAVIDSFNANSQSPDYWAGVIKDYRVDVVVLGTSTSEYGVKVEKSCFRAARDLQIPVVVLEDMPGNYQFDRNLLPNLVVVESELVVNHIRQKTAMPSSANVISGASVRYDLLRLQVKQGRQLNIKNSSHRLVWLGQPETLANIISLEKLLPHLSRMGLELLFRAHPRDDGYHLGKYERLFWGCKNKIIDVSNYDIGTFFTCQPGLVLSHFSSLAIEFSFLGTPCCNVLFPESGGKIYTEMTGLKRPFLCEAGGSGTIYDSVSLECELERLLFDEVARKAQMAYFDDYFNIKTLQQPVLKKAIEDMVLSKQKTGK